MPPVTDYEQACLDAKYNAWWLWMLALQPCLLLEHFGYDPSGDFLLTIFGVLMVLREPLDWWRLLVSITVSAVALQLSFLGWQGWIWYPLVFLYLCTIGSKHQPSDMRYLWWELLKERWRHARQVNRLSDDYKKWAERHTNRMR